MISESPILLPPRYTRALANQVEGIQQLRKMLSTIDSNSGSLVEKTINNNFIDWLVQTEKSNHIIDLIKMDRSGKNGGHISTAGTDTRETGGAAILKGIGEGLRDNDDDDDLFMHTSAS